MTRRPMATGPSIAARVFIAVLAVLGVTMLAAGFVVATVFARQATTEADALLTSRMQFARQLVQQGYLPRQIVARTDAQGVRATLTLSDGTVLGAPPMPGPHRQATFSAPQVRGATLTLTVDDGLLTGARTTLVRALLITGAAAMLVGAALAALASRLALAPLRRVADTAQRIVRGSRGERLSARRKDTEIGRTAEAVDAMLDELEGAERRALASESRAKDFLADAAHELRTPLAGLSIAAETLLHQELSPDQRQELLALLVREARRGSALVNGLLTVARQDAADPPPAAEVPTLPMLDLELRRFALTHPGATSTLRADPDGQPAVALIGPAALQSIVRNLLGNAFAAAGPQGRVAVRVTTGDAPTGRQVVIEVTDSGPGVPSADVERIFGRLVRLDTGRGRSDGAGSGLGLPIARGHARAAGGDLVCVPRPWNPQQPDDPGGARFRLTLPAAQPSSPLT